MEIVLVFLVCILTVITIVQYIKSKEKEDYDNFFKITGHPNVGFRPILKNNRKYQLLQDTSNIKLVGVFQQYNHPEKAEQSTKSDHCTRMNIKGEFGNKAGYDEVLYKCPSCKELHHIVFEHGDAYQCKCGLKTQAFGNGIYFWK